MTKSPRKNVPDVGIELGAACMTSARFRSSYRARFFQGTDSRWSKGATIPKTRTRSRVVFPEVKVQVRDLVRVVGIFVPLPHGGSVPGENSFYRAPRVNGHRRSGPGGCSSRAPRERSQATFRYRVRIVEVSSRVINIRGKFVLSRNLRYKTRGLHVAKHSFE